MLSHIYLCALFGRRQPRAGGWYVRTQQLRQLVYCKLLEAVTRSMCSLLFVGVGGVGCVVSGFVSVVLLLVLPSFLPAMSLSVCYCSVVVVVVPL